MLDVLIRPARPGERATLEAPQWRASPANAGDREPRLTHPDAIAQPVEQITDGHVFVAERDRVVLGFAAVLRRPDGGAELDALFADPDLWKRGVGRAMQRDVHAAL